jgi:hypothetical protein
MVPGQPLAPVECLLVLILAILILIQPKKLAAAKLMTMMPTAAYLTPARQLETMMF